VNFDDQLRRHFPHASASFIRANLSSQGAGTPAVVEHGPGTLALAESQVEEENRPRVLVRVVSVRKRLLDEDNLCEKFHVDLCRYSGALHLDSPESCHIVTTQRKAAKGEPEHTEITVFKL